MRAQEGRRGGRRRGKRAILLDIVERYWNELTGDFRHYLGLDAKDWFRHRLYGADYYALSAVSWEDFLRHCVYCSNIQGSALYDATLGDEELILQIFEEMKEEQSSKRKKVVLPQDEARPSRRGYSREVEALYDLQDNIVALRGEMGNWPATRTEKVMAKRPWFPSEKAQAMMRQRARNIRDQRIEEAKARWRKRNAR